MNDKIKRIYEALVEGAESGLSDKALYRFVVETCPKATSKKIVKASLLALSDKELMDSNILHVIYALAIKHRVDPATADDVGDDDASPAPQLKPRKRKNEEARA